MVPFAILRPFILGYIVAVVYIFGWCLKCWQNTLAPIGGGKHLTRHTLHLNNRLQACPLPLLDKQLLADYETFSRKPRLDSLVLQVNGRWSCFCWIGMGHAIASMQFLCREHVHVVRMGSHSTRRGRGPAWIGACTRFPPCPLHYGTTGCVAGSAATMARLRLGRPVTQHINKNSKSMKDIDGMLARAGLLAHTYLPSGALACHRPRNTRVCRAATARKMAGTHTPATMPAQMLVRKITPL